MNEIQDGGGSSEYQAYGLGADTPDEIDVRVAELLAEVRAEKPDGGEGGN